MRKIKTQEEIDRVRKRNQFLLGGTLVLLLVLSTAGFSLMSGDGGENSGSANENGYEFYRTNGLWATQIGSEVFAFQYLPSEIRNISVSGIYDIGMYSNQPIYFVGGGGGISEVVNNLGVYILRYQEACLIEEGCREGLPVKNCSTGNLIVFEPGNVTEVFQKESCVYIVGDTVKGSDSFLYKLLKII